MEEQILKHLKEKGSVSLFALAYHLECSVHTLEICVERMRASGFPVITNNKGHFCIAENWDEALAYCEKVLVPEAKFLDAQIKGVTSSFMSLAI